MKIGDLVTDTWGDLGIILCQVGVTDRWIVLWKNGHRFALNGCNLFLVTS
jgi:hypothetical protein